MKTKRQKLYCYVDETGQDTNGLEALIQQKTAFYSGFLTVYQHQVHVSSLAKNSFVYQTLCGSAIYYEKK